MGVAKEEGQHKPLPTPQGVSQIVSKCPALLLLSFESAVALILVPTQGPVTLLSCNSWVTAPDLISQSFSCQNLI